MEILAGARDEADRDRLRRLLFGLEFLAVDGPADYESAAEIYRICRSRGETPRKRSDCLIAAVAIRNEAERLGDDDDFEVIARYVLAAAQQPLTGAVCGEDACAAIRSCTKRTTAAPSPTAVAQRLIEPERTSPAA